MIEVKNLSLALKKKPILNNISFRVPKGRIVSLIGKSGAGKTSLLKCLSGLYPFEGEIIFQGKRGIVFQHYHLFPHMTVLENCIHPLLKVLKKPLTDARVKAIAMLELFGIEEQIIAYPSELSGGQQQRLALARAMCLDPDVLLLDEPTAALDPENRKVLIRLVKELQRKGVTFVISTHDVHLFKEISDQIYLMEFGKIISYIEDTSKIKQSNSHKDLFAL